VTAVTRALLLALTLVPFAAADASPRVATKPAKAKKAPKKKKQAPAPAKEPEPAPEPEPEIDMTEPDATPPAANPMPETGTSIETEGTVSQSVSAGDSKRAQHRFYVRGGVAHIAPLSSSRPMELADVDGPASLAIQNGPIAGSGSDVSSATIGAIILGYKLPFGGGHLSLETVLGLPFDVKFRATGTLANESIAPTALGIPTGVGPLGPELGEAKAAPPLVTLVYNVRPQAKVQPFIGAGAAMLITFDPHVTNPMLTEISQPEMSIAPAPGLVLQGGLEAKIYKGLYARLDVKFIAFMLARAEVHHIQVRTPDLPLFDTVEVGTAKMSVWVNPLIVQGGLGIDFW
jgi:outer membrane protein W